MTNRNISKRFQSFELMTDDESNFSQTSLKNTIIELQQFFPDEPLEANKINDLIDESISQIENQINDDDDGFTTVPLYNLRFIKKIRQSMQCTENLKIIRSLLDESRTNDEIINWDIIVKEGFKVECYLTFVFALMKLFEVDNSNKINKDLSFNAGRTYICLLGLPGAKRCLVWNQELVMTFFKLLNFHKKLKGEDHYLEIQIIQMLGECKNVFNIVCLNDQEDVLEKYVETLSALLENYLLSNNHSAVEIVMSCYENLENLCLRPLPDKDIEDTMYLIFCRTVDLHFVSTKRRIATKNKHGEAISDFILHLLSNYTLKSKNVLLKFIKSLLSNPDHKFEREKFQKLMDVAVKYELAIYWKCNESILQYLQKLGISSDHRQRLNGVEFAGKMLLINTTAETSDLLNIDKVPREVYLIKVLFERIYDKQDNVKLKALTSIKSAILNGNDNTKKIFSVIFQKSTSNNEHSEILDVLNEEASIFQLNLMSLLQSSGATYIKKTCLEILSHHCDNLLDNEIFVDIITTLTDDQSYLVKNQLLEMVNIIIKDHPKNNNAVGMWLDVIMSLIRDNDNKIVDSSIKSLVAIFQKIESFENTVNEAQILPWTVVKLILAKDKRGLLQNAIDSSSSSFLTQDKLRKIETHIFTSNKTEAWCILSLIAKKMKSNNPDIVVKIFLDCITEQNYDNNDFHLILEVIYSWLKIFSVNSRTQIAYKTSEVLEKAECPIAIVAHLYEICKLSRSTLSNDDGLKQFCGKLNNISKKIITDNFESFATSESNELMLSSILIYCESNTDLPTRPDPKIIELLFEFLRKVISNQLAISMQNDVPRKLNVVIIVLTRFALRDAEMASELTPDLAALLSKNVNISVIKTTMQCLNDLCKKHTSTVAPVFKEIVFKLHSKCEEVRLCALTNIYDLVMQDFIKMKGRVLLNLLACLVDKNELIQLKSQAAILSYTNDKNQNLLYTCFIESVFLFNNYIQADNFGVFPLDEIDRNFILLHGDEKRTQRLELYKFFVQNIYDINEVHLLLLLKQINVLKEKLERKKMQKSAESVSLLKDLLYIFKLICEKRGESKTKMNKGESINDDENEADDVEIPQQSMKETQMKGRKSKNTLTVNDAVPVVEKMIIIYPAFVDLIISFDNSLKTHVNELTKSIAINFASLIEYSKENFWNQVQKEYAKAEKSDGQKNKKVNKGNKKLTTEESDNDDTDDST